MTIARFQMPDGRIARFEVPEGTTPEQAQSMMGEYFAQQPEQARAPKAGVAANIGMGAIKGASDIGSTLLYPLDKLGITGRTPEERRASLKEFFAERFDPQSMAFKGGELTADIAGTAGAGGLLAKGLRAIPAAANAMPSVLNAIESGGLFLGKPAAATLRGKALDLAARMAGGATLGGVSAGMINPEDAATGAAVGALIPPAAQTAMAAGRGLGAVARGAIGNLTGAGSEAVSTAFQSGSTGNRSFLEHLRGKAEMTDVLDSAKDALDAMRAARGAEYRANMGAIAQDKTILDVAPIQQAVQKAQAIGNYKGKVINKNAAGVIEDIAATVDDWAKSSPAEFHTPEGLDALKRAIGDIRDATQYGTPGRLAADNIYNAVKQQIVDQAPVYAKTMRDYSQASELISEINRALSLGEKASADTAMRKLQSLMRNNVQTNYGNRMELAKALEQAGGTDFLPAIAGQAMSSAMPRGLARLEQSGIALSGLMNPGIWAALPFTSPRLMGESAYGLGKMARAGGAIGNRALSAPALRQLLTAPSRFALLTVPATVGAVNQ